MITGRGRRRRRPMESPPSDRSHSAFARRASRRPETEPAKERSRCARQGRGDCWSPSPDNPRCRECRPSRAVETVNIIRNVPCRPPRVPTHQCFDLYAPFVFIHRTTTGPDTAPIGATVRQVNLETLLTTNRSTHHRNNEDNRNITRQPHDLILSRPPPLSRTLLIPKPSPPRQQQQTNEMTINIFVRVYMAHRSAVSNGSRLGVWSRAYGNVAAIEVLYAHFKCQHSEIWSLPDERHRLETLTEGDLEVWAYRLPPALAPDSDDMVNLFVLLRVFDSDINSTRLLHTHPEKRSDRSSRDQTINSGAYLSGRYEDKNASLIAEIYLALFKTNEQRGGTAAAGRNGGNSSSSSSSGGGGGRNEDATKNNAVFRSIWSPGLGGWGLLRSYGGVEKREAGGATLAGVCELLLPYFNGLFAKINLLAAAAVLEKSLWVLKLEVCWMHRRN
ncbi:hypothetical protein GWI33_018118 [Rhynchophorus ferrugineus]|uniref:Uncharacterized protein n=1 Tax=Rhynchophorus ferrugineus TaxID=354439 RepID=A0A834M2Y1_RHYFE|nr:hypothetical protein GWI33_018118 [Rhynchophorus ferrugineus]